MPDGTNSEPEKPATVEAETGESEALVDLTGENILRLLQQAVDLAEGNSRYAVEIAQDLSRQLGVAGNRVAELELRVAELDAEVQSYRDKSERAEAWLNIISSEIQQQVVRKSS